MTGTAPAWPVLFGWPVPIQIDPAWPVLFGWPVSLQIDPVWPVLFGWPVSIQIVLRCPAVQFVHGVCSHSSAPFIDF
jgi:hypothetical protein